MSEDKIVQQWLDIPEQNKDGEWEFGIYRETPQADGWNASEICRVTAADAGTARRVRDILMAEFAKEVHGTQANTSKLRRKASAGKPD